MHKIKYWRKKLNISQEDLAVRVEISQSSVSKIESGSRKPSLDMIFKIARGLEICPKKLLTCDYSECNCTCSNCEIKNPNKRKTL